MADAETATDASGQYSFTGLRAGTYSVEISSFDTNEVSFSSTSGAATVGVGESKVVSFDGTYLRTAGIQGQVSADGEGLQGVTVTLMGHGEEMTEMTDAGGLYSFSKLRSGTYQVAISGYDTDDYEFEVTSKTATIATGETANVPFEGTLLRTAGIAGRVSVGGTGLDGVTVTLAGAAEATTETSGGGQYAFAGLAAGTYVVSFTNPNETAYSFESTSANVDLMDDQAAIVNFDGTHTRTASVSGMMYIDEDPQDKMYTANEPALAHAGIPLLLQGPGINDVTPGATMADGSFSFEGLTAGSYRVLVNVTEEVTAMLTKAGFAFVGDLTGEVVNVAAGMATQVNFPFRITTQTLVAGARMGAGDHLGVPVSGVELAVYARADGTGMLGEATTGDDGTAMIHFARADNTGPAGNDNIVFVKAKATGHDALAVSGNDFTEVSYASTARVSQAPAAVTLVNTMANFQYWVKSDADARGGDMPLAGWKTSVAMGETAIEMGPKPTEGKDDEMGRASFSYTVTPADLPATFTVSVDDDQTTEDYETSGTLTHVHTGLTHPDMNTAAMNDLGPIYVTWTTQKLTVGVYREVDDEPGFTDYRAPMGGDKRPAADVAKGMSVLLMTRDDNDRLRAYEYDHDGKATTDKISSMTIDKNGMASFPNLPADMEFTVRFRVGDNRMLVGEFDDGDVRAFGDDLDVGLSSGSFGDASGGVAEVKLCPESTDKMKCATWGYQWNTGSVSGNVGGPGGATVNLAADTEAEDRTTKTSTKAATKGDYSIAKIQDGEYTLSTPNTANNKFSKAKELEIYHDEATADEDDKTTYVGTAKAYTAQNFSATNQRLSIKGFVANDSNNDGRLRGNEAMAGVTVQLLQSTGAKDTAYSKVADTDETDGNGMYEFNDLAQGGKYRVAVVAGDGYAGLRTRTGAKSGVVNPDEYPAIEFPIVGKLPRWDHKTGKTMASTNAPTVSAKAPSTVSAKLQNFGLVYKDATLMGSVTDASGNSAGITVEAAICKTYTAATTDPLAAEVCNWDRGDIISTTTAKGGGFEFSGLMEGYYSVWWTGGGLARAKLNAMGKIDDDVTDDAADNADASDGTRSPASRITSMIGRNQYSTDQDFHVYNTRAGTATTLDSLRVTAIEPDGDTVNFAAQDGVDLAQSGETGTLSFSPNEVSWASGGPTIKASVSGGKKAVVKLTTAASGRSVTNLPFNKTGTADHGTDINTNITLTVTAANGYDDFVYTFDITRDSPVGNTPTSATADGDDMSFTTTGPFTKNVDATDTFANIVVVISPKASVAVTGVTCTTATSTGDSPATTHTCKVDGLKTGEQKSVTVTVTSEDGVKASKTVNFFRPASSG